MREDILSLEDDFANNEYYGTNSWTDEKYRVISGSVPVLISAPHAVNQLRGEDVRDAEKYTGAIARYVSMATNSYAIFELFTHEDPNNDGGSAYKDGVVNLLMACNIKMLLDIHSSTFSDDTDIDVVTNLHETLCGNDKLIDVIKELGKKYDVKVDENNKPNKERKHEVINAGSLVCGVPSIRLVINNKSLDIINNEDKFKKIVMLLQALVMYSKNI